MGEAVGNLLKNPVYHGLVQTVTGVQRLEQGKLVQSAASLSTLTDTCLGCHGATIEVRGMKKIRTAVGDVRVPDLFPWPNQGVGRVNPDGSIGTCTACHTRHTFSIEMARKPATCGQCHLDPDVPALNVFNASNMAISTARSVLNGISRQCHGSWVRISRHRPVQSATTAW